MSGIFGSNPPKQNQANQRPVINLSPKHKFRWHSKFPEAQLLLVVPRAIWNRARAYVPHYEAVHLAGRFGADPGDYEWEVFDNPQGLKWWRRTVGGDPAYCAAVLAPNTEQDIVELFGLLDIASDSPWWFDSIFDMAKIHKRAETISRQKNVAIEKAEIWVSIEDEYKPRNMLTTARDENGIAWRVGDLDEVTLLQNALVGLFDRARTAILPGEVSTGPIKKSTGSLKK
ncbi:MAG: hypothetical protein AAB217_13110 [Chloroflexota bacterium]